MNDIASAMKELAQSLFGIAEKDTFKVDCPYTEDPRGFVEVIGDDPFDSFSLTSGTGEIPCRNLTIFSDHISFISEGWAIVLKPSSDSIMIIVIDSTTEEIIMEECLYGSIVFSERLVSILAAIRKEPMHEA